MLHILRQGQELTVDEFAQGRFPRGQYLDVMLTAWPYLGTCSASSPESRPAHSLNHYHGDREHGAGSAHSGVVAFPLRVASYAAAGCNLTHDSWPDALQGLGFAPDADTIWVRLPSTLALEHSPASQLQPA